MDIKANIEFLIFYYIIVIETANYYLRPKSIVKPVLDRLDEIIKKLENDYISELMKHAQNTVLELDINEKFEQYKNNSYLHNTRYEQYNDFLKKVFIYKDKNKFHFLAEEVIKNIFEEDGDEESVILQTALVVSLMENIKVL
jgi:hypothetical protein